MYLGSFYMTEDICGLPETTVIFCPPSAWRDPTAKKVKNRLRSRHVSISSWTISRSQPELSRVLDIGRSTCTIDSDDKQRPRVVTFPQTYRVLLPLELAGDSLS